MKPHRTRLTLVILVLLAVMLVACQAPAAPTISPTAVPANTTEPVATALTVADKAYTLADLRAMSQVEASAGDHSATGPGLLALLQDAGLTADTISLVASDGYAADVAVAEIDDTAVIGINADGTLQALIPTVSKKAWVGGLIEIKAAETAVSGEAVLTVLGKAFTMEALKALKQVKTTMGDRTADGVGLLDVLQAADVTAETVALVAADGYAANITVAELDATAVLGFAADGTIEALIPTLPKNTWVRDVVEIREGKPSEPQAKPTTEAGQPLDEPLVLTDAAGRTVTLTAIPQRIAVVGRGPHMALHILYMFDEGRQRLVAAESRAKTPSDFLPFVDPAFLDVPFLDANPNVEQIAAMAPDLVIMKGITEDATATGLSEAGIPVLYVDLETMDAFFKDLANIGAALGNPQRAEEIAAYYQTRLDAVDAAVASLAEADKPNVLLASYSEKGGEVAMQVPAAAWMQTAEVERAGGNPVWLASAAPTDGWTVTNFEQIAQWDPEMIFLIVHYSLDPQKVIDSLKTNPNWAELQAVKNGKLYAFPQDIFGWDQPEPRWIMGVQWLAAQMHPDLYKVNMNQEVMAWFTDLYGMSPAAYEQDILPRVRMDVH